VYPSYTKSENMAMSVFMENLVKFQSHWECKRNNRTEGISGYFI